MTVRTFDVVLRRSSGGKWPTEVLQIPSARVIAVIDASGASIPFEVEDKAIVVNNPGSSTLSARIEITEDLVASSQSAERLGRRTLIVSLVTAVVSAGAALGVAWIASSAGKGDKPQSAAYKDLNECREGLNNLKTLASLDQQTLNDLRSAIRRQVDTCTERLRAAMSASPS